MRIERRTEGESRLPDLNRRPDDVSGHRRVRREPTTVTRSDQAELRRDGRQNGSTHIIVSFPPAEGVPRAGLEPATSRSSVSPSPKLSYRGAGGAKGGREKRVSLPGSWSGAVAPCAGVGPVIYVHRYSGKVIGRPPWPGPAPPGAGGARPRPPPPRPPR